MKAEPELYAEVKAPCPTASPLYSPVVARGNAHNMTLSHEPRVETAFPRDVREGDVEIPTGVRRAATV